MKVHARRAAHISFGGLGGVGFGAWLLAMTCLCATEPSFAAPASTDASASGSGLEEIVVTAQRRTENLENTPISIAVVSGDTLAKQQITTEDDLRLAAPGLNIKASTGSNQINYVIRGQSLDPFSNNRPGVLPYFNEVQLGVNTASSAFYDLQSIQVLKGPQGTLFGRSATGGAVLITTQQPTNELSGYVSGTVGNYDAKKYEGALNVPLISDVLLARVAAFYQSRDGYQYNTYTEQNIGGFDRYGVRGSLTAQSGPFKNELVVDFSSLNGQNTVASIHSLVGSAIVPIGLLYAGGATSDATFNALAGLPPGTLNGTWAAYAAAHPRANPNGISAFLAGQLHDGPFTVSIDSPDFARYSNTVLSNVTSVDIASDLQFKNVFGFAHVNSDIGTDNDGTPYPIDSGSGTTEAHDYSEEAQLLGTAFGHDLTYVSGLYFSSEKTNIFEQSSLVTLPPVIASPAQYNIFDQKSTTYALYGQGTYNLEGATGVQGLAATAGARLTSEKVENTILPGDVDYQTALTNPTEQLDQSRTTRNVSWTVGLQDQVTPELLFYVVSRRSYKNAGFNGTIAPIKGDGAIGGNSFDPETFTDAEIGAKFQGFIASIPTRVNIAAYHDWIKNDQRVVFTIANEAPAALSVNVPRSAISGVELDGQINPVSWLQLGLTYNYINAEFTDNVVSVQGLSTVFGTYPDAPKYSGLIFAEASLPVFSGLTATVRGEVYAQDSQYNSSTANLNPDAVLPSYSVTNFRLGIEDSKVGWSVNAVLKNAFNRVYYVGGVSPGFLFGFNTEVPGDPRTFAVEARYKF